MHILSQEQFNEMQSDLADLIGAIQEAENSFDAESLKRGIILEIKKSLSSKNSPFKSLESEAIEITETLINLKKIKKLYADCKNESEIKLAIIIVISIFTGSILTLIIMKFAGF